MGVLLGGMDLDGHRRQRYQRTRSPLAISGASSALVLVAAVHAPVYLNHEWTPCSQWALCG